MLQKSLVMLILTLCKMLNLDLEKTKWKLYLEYIKILLIIYLFINFFRDNFDFSDIFYKYLINRKFFL